MTRANLSVKIETYGIYDGWDGSHKTIPQIKEFTNSVPAVIGIEFGFVVKILGGHGKIISYKIDHPPMKKSNGNNEPPFTGEFFIRGNTFRFFLGDTIWEPIYNKLGTWELSISHEKKILHKMAFHIYNEEME